MKRGLAALVVLAGVAGLLAGCASQDMDANDPSGSFTTLFTGFGAKDLKAKHPGNSQPYGTVTQQGTTGEQVYPGTDSRAANAGDPDGTGTIGARAEGDGFQLNFENADAAAICKTILGDILQLNYTLDSRVSGQINLSSSRAVPKANLIGVLETALKAINASIVREGTLYRVIPASEGVGNGPMEFGTASDGYGTTVIPVKYVSVQMVMRILENFATKPGAIKADPGTNLIIVQGTAQERRSAIDAASVLDTDLMKAQSVGIFPLANSSPETLIVELGKILDTGEGGFGQNQVQFQPMTRMNGVLVVAKRKEVLETVTRWIHRLDRADPSVQGVKVYRLKYAQAKNVAAMLNDILAGKASATGQKDQDALQPSQTGTNGSLVQSSANSTSTTASSSTSSQSGLNLQQGQNQANSPLNQPIFSSSSPTAQNATDPSGSSPNSGQGSLPKVRVTPDLTNNSLLIVANAQEYKIVEAAIRQLDRAPTQVAIEATIAEVTLTDQLQYGVQAYLNSKQGSIGLTTSTTSSAISAVVPGANLILGSASSPRLVLNALHSFTNVKVLSSPSLVVVDNQAAVLEVGDQVAIKTQTSQSTDSTTAPIINSITYKDTGIILRVMPHVHANGVVNLDVEQEISNVVDNTGGVDGLTPTISQRRVKSSIVVTSGQTVLLAGMISESQSRSRSGIPGVVQWKWLGDILSNNNNTANRSELIIFIKPQIMRDQADAQSIAEEFRARMTGLRPEPGPIPARPPK